MVWPATQLTIELIPHCTSVPRDGLAGSHDVRPLAELGMRQAEALVAVIGSDVDGIYQALPCAADRPSDPSLSLRDCRCTTLQSCMRLVTSGNQRQARTRYRN